MFSNSIFSKDQTVQDRLQTVETHNEAINRYHVFFKDYKSASSLVDARFEHLSRIINQEKETVQQYLEQIDKIKQEKCLGSESETSSPRSLFSNQN